MGLPICRSIIEAHGGRIAADNDSAHGGARFYFTLPAAGSPVDAAGADYGTAAHLIAQALFLPQPSPLRNC